MGTPPSDEWVELPDLASLLAARRCAFAIGVPGALAEFQWAEHDRVEARAGPLALATARGAIAIRPHPALRARRESRSTDAHGHRGRTLALCLPASTAQLPPRRGLTVLGPDLDAVRRDDRDAVLFDLGLGLGHIEACVRTSDVALLAILRAHCGEALFGARGNAVAAIKRASPHRVFRSRLGRIEVFQPIPSRARGESSPPGPHTHLLPAMLAAHLARRGADPSNESTLAAMLLYLD